MKEREAALMAYFEEKITACVQKRDNLIADDRVDEANFEKIRANVYDIFRTVYTAGKRAEKRGKSAEVFFTQRLEEIPKNWKTALEKAKQHDDALSVQIETVKLETAGEIKKVFAEIWEGNV